MDDTDHALFPRFSAELVTTALKDTPVVMVTGPRQRGKTTLVRDLVAGSREFITMDDDTVLAAARSDPTGLVRALDRTTIDEVQRVPDLLRAIFSRLAQTGCRTPYFAWETPDSGETGSCSGYYTFSIAIARGNRMLFSK
jgi:hypothetical protein